MVFTMQLLENKLYRMIYYKYIYYRLYKFFLSISRTDIPELNALLIITFLGFANLIAVYGVFKLNVPSFQPDLILGKVIVVIIFCAIGFVNYIMFIKERKYDKLLIYYQATLNTNKFNVIVAKTLFLSFTLFWILTLIICGIITRT